ncbi:MAG TPA: alpha/beta hydrolase [Nitrososphaerales archaeon]|nr:alpha/beta hydrolase [Nitrososphaerales archaeon]
MQATERIADVGEFKVNFASAGKGEKVLLFHGSDRREDWHVWEPMLPLSDSYNLLIPDLLGHGKSSLLEETPDYRTQAQVMKDLLDGLSSGTVNLVGAGWGGQVALELALTWPDDVRSLVLVASTYGKEQVRRLPKLRRPTLIVYAEDDMVTQLKAGYLLRDAIGTSRLEVMAGVARDPRYGFTVSHRLEKFRAPQVMQLMRLFLSKPEQMISEPPEMEDELRGMAMRKEPDEGAGATSTP